MSGDEVNSGMETQIYSPNGDTGDNRKILLLTKDYDDNRMPEKMENFDTHAVIAINEMGKTIERCVKYHA